MEQYIYQEYPKWVYRRAGDQVISVIVNSQEERDALPEASSWVNTPAEVAEKPQETQETPEIPEAEATAEPVSSQFQRRRR